MNKIQNFPEASSVIVTVSDDLIEPLLKINAV